MNQHVDLALQGLFFKKVHNVAASTQLFRLRITHALNSREAPISVNPFLPMVFSVYQIVHYANTDGALIPSCEVTLTPVITNISFASPAGSFYI